MIQKISAPGKGFRGVLNYTLAENKLPEIVASTMAGENPRSLAREFGDAREANEAVGKPVFHASLSADPGDAVSTEQWRAIAEAYVERMGYGDSLWVAVRHHDTDHDHIHIVASRIDHGGERVKDFQEKKRGESIVRDLEREHELREVAPSREAGRRAIAREDLAAFERTGAVSVKVRLQEHLALAAGDDRPTMGDFAERLEAQGVAVRLNVSRTTGRVSGISYELDGVAFKGSDVGRDFSWQGLQTRKGISYDPERDLPRLEALERPPAPGPLERAAVAMPPQEKLVETYRAAAVVVTRAEVLDRELDLSRISGLLQGAISYPETLSASQDRAKESMRQTLQGAVDKFDRVFTNPPEAFARFRATADKVGYVRAGEILAESPGTYGQVRGVAVGPLATRTRQAALHSATSLGATVRHVGEKEAEHQAKVPKLAQAAARVPQAQGQLARVQRLISRLPSRQELQHDLLRAGTTLGIPTVRALSLTVSVARTVSLYVVSRLRSLAHEHDRSLGR